jgi:hypothetical protein
MSNSLVYAESKCINKSITDFMESSFKNEFITLKNQLHTLIYSTESCGIKGCDYYIFSKIGPTCTKVTLNERGFLVPKSFKFNVVKIRKNKETIKYKFKNFKFRPIKI